MLEAQDIYGYFSIYKRYKRICHGLSLIFKNVQALKVAEETAEEMAEETKIKTHTSMQSCCIKI